jgi:hypothetical protein
VVVGGRSRRVNLENIYRKNRFGYCWFVFHIWKRGARRVTAQVPAQQQYVVAVSTRRVWPNGRRGTRASGYRCPRQVETGAGEWRCYRYGFGPSAPSAGRPARSWTGFLTGSMSAPYAVNTAHMIIAPPTWLWRSTGLTSTPCRLLQRGDTARARVDYVCEPLPQSGASCRIRHQAIGVFAEDSSQDGDRVRLLASNRPSAAETTVLAPA